MSKLEFDIIAILRDRPGSTGLDIHKELTAKSWVGKKFGYDSLITAIFGPSIGNMYVVLARLELLGVLRFEWGPYGASGYRPRRYFIEDDVGI